MKDIKRNCLYILILLFAVLLIPQKANALPLCTAKNKQQYINMANKIEFKYEYTKDEETDQYYFIIRAANVDKSLIIEYDGEEYSGMGTDNYIVFNNHFEDNKTYKFKIKVEEGVTCALETVTFKSVKIPKVNIYSETAECIEYEEAPMCARYYQGEFKDYKEFQTKLKQYLEKLEKSKIEEYKDERSFFQKLIDFYMDHAIICGTLTFIVFALIIVFVTKKLVKNKKKIKL